MVNRSGKLAYERAIRLSPPKADQCLSQQCRSLQNHTLLQHLVSHQQAKELKDNYILHVLIQWFLVNATRLPS